MLRPISKYLFNEYWQCAHRFWLLVNEKEIGERTTINTQEAYFREQQKLIEKYALEYLGLKENCEFESQKTVEVKGFKATADIYEKHNGLGKTAIYEVRNSKTVKGHHIWELAFLAYQFVEAGEPLRKLFIIHVNSEYVHDGGQLEPEKLLKIVDVSKRVWRNMAKMRQKIAEVRAFANGPHPPTSLPEHSCRAKDCLYIRRYHPNLPKNTIYDLKKLSKIDRKTLLAEGVIDMLDIPESYITDDLQRMQLSLAKDKKPLIQRTSIEEWLKQLQYPYYFIDYEALTSAIPLYAQTQPFQHVVFQYSLHRIQAPGAALEHFEFLSPHKALPAKDLLEKLAQEMNGEGSVFVWHDSFEKARNREMAKLYPAYTDLLLGMNERMVDMQKLFNLDDGLYLHPDFQGKSSIKTVLPVLVPTATRYSNLVISDGMSAAILWFQYLTTTITVEEEQQLRKDLLAYCKLDTLGMVDVLNAIQSLFE